MTSESERQSERVSLLQSTLLVLIYISLGYVSLSTAFIQANTAAVWIPSGFAVGVLLAKGLRLWPVVMIGSFLLNLSVALGGETQSGPLAASLGAATIASGNAGEAIVGAFLTQRFANGTAFLFRPRSLFRFLLVTVPLAPLASVFAGLAVSRTGLFSPRDSLGEVALTWYVANAAGVLIFTGLTVLALTRRPALLSRGQLLEAALLALLLTFAVQAVCGMYFTSWVEGWPTPYMIIPLLLWAAVRFGASGGLVAIAFVTAGAALGTMYGFVVFPAETPWRALVYLQVYLAMLSVMTLAITAALAEADTARLDLEYRVEARTREIEKLLGQREVFTALVAHDLKSPIYGVRNTLKTVGGAAKRGELSQDELISALAVMEETCTTLADRIGTMLPVPFAARNFQGAFAPERLDDIIRDIATAHQLTLRDRGMALVVNVPNALTVENASEVEHILDTLIDNAIRHSPERSAIRVSASETGRVLRIAVADEGPGVPPDEVSLLFQRGEISQRTFGPRSKLGLFLAQQHAAWLGGRVEYTPAEPHGAVFTLILPMPTANGSHP